MMTFNDCVHKYKLKNKATSKKLKICQVLSSLSPNEVGSYLRDDTFEFDVENVYLHASTGTH